jgi:hypothetical protein
MKYRTDSSRAVLAIPCNILKSSRISSIQTIFLWQQRQEYCQTIAVVHSFANEENPRYQNCITDSKTLSAVLLELYLQDVIQSGLMQTAHTLNADSKNKLNTKIF